MDDTITLPTWDESNARVVAGEANPIHQFIVDNEPANEEAEKEFRDGLLAVIHYLTGEQK